ncbi:MAG TPA: hypothetical protein GXX70_08165, partial [Tepidimicrobium sp.]|nr:hypothetical protein [Tepidimicrobium sp.]
MKDNRGIALIEIVAVISIISIILSIPMLRNNSRFTNKERRELIEFKNDINYARNRAIVESKTHYVTILPHSNSYNIYGIEGLMRRIQKKKIFEHGITIRGSNFEGNEIVFNRFGSPLKGGRIRLESSKGEIIEITVKMDGDLAR